MDNGGEQRSFEAIRRWVEGVVADPPKLKLYTHIALVAVVWFGVLSPLTDRMRAAEKSLAKAHKQDKMAKAMEHLVEQRDAYRPLLTGSDDIVDWQNFVLSKVDAAGVRLSTIEPYGADKRGPFAVMNLRVAVQAQEYSKLADFLDRLEHGERLVRLEQMIIDQTASALLLTITLRGLAKPGLDVIPLQDPLEFGDAGAPDGEAAAADGDAAATDASPGSAAAEPAGDDVTEAGAQPAPAEGQG